LLLVFLRDGRLRGLEPSALSAGNFGLPRRRRGRDDERLLLDLRKRVVLSRPGHRHPADVPVVAALTPRHLAGPVLAGVGIGTLQALVCCWRQRLVEFDWRTGSSGPRDLAPRHRAAQRDAAGIAQTLASRIQTMQGFHLLANLVLFPLLFFSGAFFPVDGLPTWLELLARIIPLSYGVDALLLAAYADGTAGYFGLAVDFIVLAALSVAAYGFGLARMPRLTWSGR
jgi:ABC-2 type transport system permease protein